MKLAVLAVAVSSLAACASETVEPGTDADAQPQEPVDEAGVSADDASSTGTADDDADDDGQPQKVWDEADELSEVGPAVFDQLLLVDGWEQEYHRPGDEEGHGDMLPLEETGPLVDWYVTFAIDPDAEDGAHSLHAVSVEFEDEAAAEAQLERMYSAQGDGDYVAYPDHEVVLLVDEYGDGHGGGVYLYDQETYLVISYTNEDVDDPDEMLDILWDDIFTPLR